MIIIPGILKSNDRVEEDRLRYEVGQAAIGNLELERLIKRSHDPETKRIYVSLTDKAREMIDGKDES